MKRLLIVLILFFSYATYSQTAEEYFDIAYDKAENGDYYGAIADLNKAIELDPNDAKAYYNRGLSKGNLKDYYGAISDFNKSIELDPRSIAYYNRGWLKHKLKDYYGAIADYNKAIELDPNDAMAALVAQKIFF